MIGAVDFSAGGHSSLKSLMCVFLCVVMCVFLCLTMRVFRGMFAGLCVCVCACFPGDQQFISLLQWRFSLQITRKVEMGLFQQPQLPSGALSTTNNCHFELQSLHFFILLDWFIFWCWPISAYLNLKLWCNSSMKNVHLKNPKRKKTSLLNTTALPQGLIWSISFSKLLATAFCIVLFKCFHIVCPKLHLAPTVNVQYRMLFILFSLCSFLLHLHYFDKKYWYFR